MLRLLGWMLLGALVGCSAPGNDGSGSSEAATGAGFEGFVDASEPCDAVAVQSDGKIVATCEALQEHVRRFNVDGTEDLAFGDVPAQGRTFVDGSIVRILPDDSIVVIGPARETHLIVQHLDRDGHLDPHFGANGSVTLDVADNTLTNDQSLEISPDGLILVASVFVAADGSLVRGAREIDAGGRVVRTLAVPFDGAVTAVRYDRVGRILVAGESSGGLAIARFSDDDLDPAFGHAGVATLAGDWPFLAPTRDGVYVRTSISTASSVARLREDGSLDTSWGHVGIASGRDFPFPSAVDASDRVLVQRAGRLQWWNADGSVAREVGALPQGAGLVAVGPNGTIAVAVAASIRRGGVLRFAD